VVQRWWTKPCGWPTRMANKLRCASCHNYCAPEQIYRKSGLSSWCSAECFKQRSAFKVRAEDSGDVGTPRARQASRRKSDIPHSIRLEVALRDKSCRWCGTQRGLHQHHVLYRSQGGDHQPSNLIVLCHECHAHAHSVGSKARELLLGVIWLTYAGQRISVPELARRLKRSDDLHVR
jgi:5-methylcytosine-specific restriction endonuclease McrA